MAIGVAASQRFLEWTFSPRKDASKVPDDRYLRGLSSKINGLRWSDQVCVYFPSGLGISTRLTGRGR